MRVYIVYVDGREVGFIKAKSHNAAEKKARKLFPEEKHVDVLYSKACKVHA